MKIGNIRVRFDQGEPGGIRVSMDVTDGDMPITPEVWHRIEFFAHRGVAPTVKLWLDGVSLAVPQNDRSATEEK